VHVHPAHLAAFAAALAACSFSAAPSGTTLGTDLDDVRLSLYYSEFAPSDGVVAFDRLNLVNQ
jgi:hypothetical protein